MKKYLFVLIGLVLLIGISACGKDKNPTEPQIMGYRLDQFINSVAVSEITDPLADEGVDFRSLYNYEIVASDGFSPRQRLSTAGYDLDWNLFKDGYIVPDNEFRTMFFNDIVPGAFEVKNAAKVRLYRRIAISDTLGNKHYKELRALPIHSVLNWDGEPEDAIKLSDLISEHSNFNQIIFYSADGFGRNYSPEQIAEGYYLLESERTTFPALNDVLPNNQKRFKFIDRIELDIDLSAFNGNYLNTEDTLHDIEFVFPQQFDGFTGTELTDF